ncbi:uncharacterized protein LOC105735872 isoform X2 [Apis florea]|uniref:uncharacterized protein LOC105735872 isoform X2 n=1 Tax=Apis florea TaxID=7463 RepID=UPI0012FED712|nr:uncharacterized protein LOC105735872 isoform X2 [Apis florea]
MEGVRTSRLFFSMLVLRFTNEHMSIVRKRIAIFRSFAFFSYEIYYCYVLESKFTSLVCHVTLNDVTEANRKPSKRRYNPNYRSKSSCDVICAVEPCASVCVQRRDRDSAH